MEAAKSLPLKMVALQSRHMRISRVRLLGDEGVGFSDEVLGPGIEVSMMWA